MKRKDDILLGDLDAFFASVEQRDHPELKGRPVIVGGVRGNRGVVSTCSYEARAYGVRSAMPIRRAALLCPEGVFRPVDMKRYQEVSRQVSQVFERFTPAIETVSIDEAYLAVTRGQGLEAGSGIRAAVRRELDLAISIGVSSNKLLAKIACEMAKPDGIKALWPQDVPDVLWPMPARVLPGVGPVTEKKLKSHGLTLVQDIAQAPEETLLALLGQNGIAIKNYARGIDERELETEQEIKSISEETTFSEDLFDRREMLAVLQELSAGVGYRLRSHGLFAHTVSIKLRYADFKTITRDISLSRDTNQDSDIYRAARSLFEGHCGKPPWRLLGVRLSSLRCSRQLSLFPEDTEGTEERLTSARDRLRKKYGQEMVIQASRMAHKEEDKT